MTNETKSKKDLSTEALKKKTKNELKDLLKLEGLPLSGNKPDLIWRLQNYSGKPKPAVKWQCSQAKKDLKKALLNPHSPLHKMSAAEIHMSDEKYKQYPLFQSYLEELKECIKEEKTCVEVDDLAVKMYVMNFPRSALNKRGYPHWDDHPAKKLMESDVANGVHKNCKSASEFRDTRTEYKPFPVKVIAKRVNDEVKRQKAEAFWAHKRSKKAMKNHVNNVPV